MIPADGKLYVEPIKDHPAEFHLVRRVDIGTALERDQQVASVTIYTEYSKYLLPQFAAAPELLARLKVSSEWIRKHAYEFGGRFTCDPGCGCIACVNDAAIARAVRP